MASCPPRLLAVSFLARRRSHNSSDAPSTSCSSPSASFSLFVWPLPSSLVADVIHWCGLLILHSGVKFRRLLCSPATLSFVLCHGRRSSGSRTDDTPKAFGCRARRRRSSRHDTADLYLLPSFITCSSKLPTSGSPIFNDLAEAFRHLHLIFRMVSVHNRRCTLAC